MNLLEVAVYQRLIKIKAILLKLNINSQMDCESEQYWISLQDEIEKACSYVDNGFNARALIDIKKLLKHHEAIAADNASAKCEEITIFLKKKDNVALG